MLGSQKDFGRATFMFILSWRHDPNLRILFEYMNKILTWSKMITVVFKYDVIV